MKVTHILSGLSTTPIDDDKSNFLWFPIPEVSMTGYQFLNDVSTSQDGLEFKSQLNVFTLNLMDPSQQWRKDTEEPNVNTSWKFYKRVWYESLVFNELQRYKIKVNFEDPKMITITDKQNTDCTGQFKPTQSLRDVHVNCVMINDDLYLIIENQMVVIQKLEQKVIEGKGENNLSPDFEISVPHLYSTPFVVKDILFIVGGCDSHYEPFPDIYQFNHDTLSWQMYGRTTISRYGAPVVVFKRSNGEERVFIAGGFKQENQPCSVIEMIPIEVTYC